MSEARKESTSNCVVMFKDVVGNGTNLFKELIHIYRLSNIRIGKMGGCLERNGKLNLLSRERHDELGEQKQFIKVFFIWEVPNT